MTVDTTMTISVCRGTAQVQESALGHSVEWIQPPAPMAANEYLPLNDLLPTPRECHASATAWTVLPAGSWLLFLRHQREGTGCQVEAWIVSRTDYRSCGADSPAIIRAIEADPVSETLVVVPAERSSKAVESSLKQGDTPSLLGAAQLLVDGGRLNWAAESPLEVGQVEAIWSLLPTRQRALLGWTTYLDSSRHKLAIGASRCPVPGSWAWDKVGDYPEGDYERALHQAAFQGDEDTVSRLLNRGSRTDVMILGLLLLGALVLGQLILASTGWKPPPLIRPAAQEHAP